MSHFVLNFVITSHQLCFGYFVSTLLKVLLLFNSTLFKRDDGIMNAIPMSPFLFSGFHSKNLCIRDCNELLNTKKEWTIQYDTMTQDINQQQWNTLECYLHQLCFGRNVNINLHLSGTFYTQPAEDKSFFAAAGVVGFSCCSLVFYHHSSFLHPSLECIQMQGAF